MSLAYISFLIYESIYLICWADPNFPEHTASSSSSSSSSSKRPRLDQIPAANLDADDPLTDVRACTASLSDCFVVFSHNPLIFSSFFLFFLGWRRWGLWGRQRWWWHCSTSGRIGEDQEGEGRRARAKSKVSFQLPAVWQDNREIQTWTTFFIPILGTGAKSRGGEDSYGEYLEWQSFN